MAKLTKFKVNARKRIIVYTGPIDELAGKFSRLALRDEEFAAALLHAAHKVQIDRETSEAIGSRLCQMIITPLKS